MIELRRFVSGSIRSWECPTDPGEPGTGVRRLSVTDEEVEILRFLGNGLSVLEFGTGLGVSTRALASTARRVVTIDPDPWVAREVAPHLPSSVTFYSSPPESGAFDVAFVDGDHAKASVRADLAHARRLVPSGFLAIHDGHLSTVRAAMDGVKVLAELDTQCRLLLARFEN